MSQVIVHTNENGGVTVTYPAPEFLETNTIEDVLAKDCPDHAIIIDDSELPQGEDEFFNAWELVDNKVVVNLDKKNAIILQQQAPIVAKQNALNKLMALGLTEEEALALGAK
jgi:hypothetical protein